MKWIPSESSGLCESIGVVINRMTAYFSKYCVKCAVKKDSSQLYKVRIRVTEHNPRPSFTPK